MIGDVKDEEQKAAKAAKAAAILTIGLVGVISCSFGIAAWAHYMTVTEITAGVDIIIALAFAVVAITVTALLAMGFYKIKSMIQERSPAVPQNILQEKEQKQKQKQKQRVEKDSNDAKINGIKKDVVHLICAKEVKEGQNVDIANAFIKLNYNSDDIIQAISGNEEDVGKLVSRINRYIRRDIEDYINHIKAEINGIGIEVEVTDKAFIVYLNNFFTSAEYDDEFEKLIDEIKVINQNIKLANATPELINKFMALVPPSIAPFGFYTSYFFHGVVGHASSFNPSDILAADKVKIVTEVKDLLAKYDSTIESLEQRAKEVSDEDEKEKKNLTRKRLKNGGIFALWILYFIGIVALIVLIPYLSSVVAASLIPGFEVMTVADNFAVIGLFLIFGLFCFLSERLFSQNPHKWGVVFLPLLFLGGASALGFGVFGGNLIEALDVVGISTLFILFFGGVFLLCKSNSRWSEGHKIALLIITSLLLIGCVVLASVAPYIEVFRAGVMVDNGTNVTTIVALAVVIAAILLMMVKAILKSNNFKLKIVTAILGALAIAAVGSFLAFLLINPVGVIANEVYTFLASDAGLAILLLSAFVSIIGCGAYVMLGKTFNDSRSKQLNLSGGDGFDQGGGEASEHPSGPTEGGDGFEPGEVAAGYPSAPLGDSASARV